MNGYIQNQSPRWRHALKRPIGPGHKVSLDELYVQYGEKHNLNPGEEFVRWLRQVKLRDSSVWYINYVPEQKELPKETVNEAAPVQKETNVEQFDANAPNNDISTDEIGMSPMNEVNDEINEIVNLSVRAAKEKLGKVKNLKVLREAHRQANQLPNKTTLCVEIKKRIKELETFGRR